MLTRFLFEINISLKWMSTHCAAMDFGLAFLASWLLLPAL